jgi:hypothetical protein
MIKVTQLRYRATVTRILRGCNVIVKNSISGASPMAQGKLSSISVAMNRVKIRHL